ncbi:glycoside hydrolase family 3 C-terminal domain-containing protein [Streptomyces longispororuber]|uniref:glycoside hydrolase family 3 C-terminal domain-containing protein n=1 Tax=Streptomyces longispororuber TaxID=68230 RepID=UPI00210AB134|nr:glycoside hydrolase family 3 C-terminal domain-containing protein [Streptomyces longispororuber]MCQ4210668.1 glycoside hydrolase family 3 C-terminal domain-containing protein [Streptomyces longispororuber]
MSDAELARLVDKLDTAQKVRLVTGGTTWRTRAEPAVGLREVVTSDGPAGVRGESWDERNTSVLLPSASALAASWDEQLVEKMGRLLAREARGKGVHLVLAPNLNLHRSPLGGRHFECFAEDPELVARTGAALVRGLQHAGVAATAKHLVANDSETGRLTVDVRVDERTLREVYLLPFEVAVDAGVRAVMAGYNRVNGASMTASPLLTDIVKGEWGFDGVVLSDWGALRTAVDTARGGLDLAMPGPGGPWDDELVAAVRDGLVPQAALDDKVRRLLLLARRVGVLGPAPRPPRARPCPGRARRLLRRAASAGAVLLANDGVLPLPEGELTSLAVIGAHADRPRVQGGGSAGVFPDRVVTPLDAIRARLGDGVRVVHSPGPDLPAGPAPLDIRHCADPRTGEPGVLLRVLDRAGRALCGEHRLTGRLLEPPLPPGAHTVELSTLLTPPNGGEWLFGVAGFGRLTLSVDGRVLIDDDFPRRTDDPAVIHVDPPGPTAPAHLTAGRPVLVVARRQLAAGTGRATVLTAAPPPPPAEAAIAEAVTAARHADAAVVVVGTTDSDESEGRDRTGLALPGHQDALVRAVAAANPRTVVVVNSGGPVELPWREKVNAVLLTWLPGQEGGDALAAMLLGDTEPGGRLPTTWGTRLADVPVSATRPVDDVLTYAEGLHVGHRAWLRAGRTPAYWFGHGLGYTAWSYENVGAPRLLAAGADFTVTVQVRNRGRRTGREVVQVYLSRDASAVERPVRWLAGYAAVTAAPGETVRVTVPVPARALRHWSVADRAWAVEPGVFTVHVGRSAGDLPLTAELRVQPEDPL